MRGRSGVVSQYVLAKEARGATTGTGLSSFQNFRGIGLSSFQNFPPKANKGCHWSRDVEHVL